MGVVILVDSIDFRVAIGSAGIETFGLHTQVELRVVLSKDIQLLVQSGEWFGEPGHGHLLSLTFARGHAEVVLNRVGGLFEGLQDLGEIVQQLLLLFELLVPGLLLFFSLRQLHTEVLPLAEGPF